MDLVIIPWTAKKPKVHIFYTIYSGKNVSYARNEDDEWIYFISSFNYWVNSIYHLECECVLLQ